MRASSPGAIALSATFHAAVVGALVAFSLWVKKANEITPQIFDIVDMDGIEIGDHFEMPGAPSANPGVKFARPKTKRVKIPSAAEIAAAQAKAEREAAKQAEKPGKNAPDKTSPRNKTTSYAEFQKKNSKQLAANQKTRSGGAKGSSAPGIDEKGLVDDLMKAAAGPRGDGGGTNGSKVMIPALSAYFDRLISALRAAHEMPDSVDSLLVAKVSFYLSADGSISNVKIVTTSGNPDFDASVVDAFRKVRSVGAVPGGKSGTYVVPFRMAE